MRRSGRNRLLDSSNQTSIFSRSQSQRAYIVSRSRAHIMRDMQERAAACSRSQDRHRRNIPPARCVEKHSALAPADGNMRVWPQGRAQITCREVGTPVFLRRDQWQNQCGVHAIRFDHDFNIVPGFLPLRIARNRTAHPTDHRKTEHCCDQADEACESCADQPMARRRSHSIDQSPFTSRAARRNPAAR